MKKRKWLIWVLVIVLVLCCIGTLLGGGGYYYYTRQVGAAELAPLPVVEIFYPPNLAELPFGSVIPVGAEASVPEGNQITLLQLWADGELIGELYGSSTSLTGSFGWAPPAAGEHTLVGRAYNQEGGEGTGAIHVLVQLEITDADQDGVADGEDDCPDQVGAPEWNGCPPVAAGVLGDAWGPGGGSPGDEVLGAMDEAVEGDHPEGEEPPSEDPPVVEPEPDPPVPPPMALLELEGLGLRSAIGARDVYCYVTLTSRALERVPSDADGNFVEMGAGHWNIGDFMGGALGRMLDVPEAGPLHFEMDCWGHFSDDPLDPDVRHMGIVSLDHGPADWDGRELTAHGEMDANWFDVTYRICRGNCEVVTLPTPYGLHLVNMGAHYELSWFWDADPSVDNSDVGFHVYRNGIIIATVPENHPFNLIALLPAQVEPPLCNQEYRFEVRAVRGADVQLSNPSNIVWSTSPGPCPAENMLAVRSTIPLHNSALWVFLEHVYTRSHTDRVVVGAYPTIGGALSDAFLFTWDGTSVGGGTGSTWNLISYKGTEPLATDGLRLFMLTVADGINPGGEIIYERDVPFPFTWQPGLPDLRIQDIFYPEGDDILRIVVSNSGVNQIQDWEPTFAFFQEVGGVRTRVDALDSPPGMAPVTIQPFDKRIINWPGWTAIQFALLEPIYEIEVDPDNLVAETNEENNVYEAYKPNIQVTLQTLRILSYGVSDAAGFGGCFAGMSGNISSTPEMLYFTGYGEKATYQTFLDIYYPHELGLLVCPPMEYDIETELIPVLNSGSCTATCGAFFGAHGQPVFAEGKHTPWWWPIPGWGDDYCSACYTLAGQTSINRDNNVFDIAYAGGNLEIRTRLYDRDILSSGAHLSHTVCDFTGVIPAADMAALPVMNRTLTDPGGACEIVVSVEPFP